MIEFEGWRFCPRCGSTLVPRSSSIVCSSCSFEFWAASKPGVSAVCVRDQQVLLIRRADEPWRSFWGLPGGFLDEGEHPRDGLRREVLEETGLEVSAESLLGIWMGSHRERSILNLCWVARVERGTLVAGDEIGDVRWFELDGLHELTIEPELTRPALSAWLEHTAGTR